MYSQWLNRASVVLCFVAVAYSHGSDEQDIAHPADPTDDNVAMLSSYSSWMTAHIALMTLGWVFMLPLAIVLVVPRVGLSFLAQLCFLGLNVLGLICGEIYKANTSDVLSEQGHCTWGWIVILVILIQGLLGVANVYARRRNAALETEGPTVEGAGAERQRYRYLDNLLESPTSDSFRDPETSTRPSINQHNRLFYICSCIYTTINYLLLPFGFIAILTGFATYVGANIRDGHNPNGSVLLGVGIITIARWAGCWSSLGWAWNIKSKVPGKRDPPSAEFVESCLIFLLGASQIIPAMSDAAHQSVAIMGFGAGLSGMLIESKLVRKGLQAGVMPALDAHHHDDKSSLDEPESYRISTNPIPALVIVLIGTALNWHHHDSEISIALHSIWGGLIQCAGLSRIFTYILCFISPPKSSYPGRPPTEIIAAFCMICAGFLVLATHDHLIQLFEAKGWMPMIIMMEAVGLTTVLMAWIILVVAVKGWATRRDGSSDIVADEIWRKLSSTEMQ